ncbi:MAG: hypothetical protein QNJ27_04440 [Simkaniaceae bacterium]|nr:hypothetical protein [Simkaniaceae bacterium]
MRKAPYILDLKEEVLQRVLINYKAKQAGMKSSNGFEKGTLSHCPKCGNKRNQTVEGGSVEAVVLRAIEMLLEHYNRCPLAFDTKVAAPKDLTYLRIPVGKSSSSLGRGPKLSK